MAKATHKTTESIDIATMGLPGVPSLPGPDLAASAVVAPAAPSQEGAPKKSPYLDHEQIARQLSKILAKVRPGSGAFNSILSAMSDLELNQERDFSASHST